MNYWAELRQEGIHKSRKRWERKNYEHIQKMTERINTETLIEERDREREKHNREKPETKERKITLYVNKERAESKRTKN